MYIVVLIFQFIKINIIMWDSNKKFTCSHLSESKEILKIELKNLKIKPIKRKILNIFF